MNIFQVEDSYSPDFSSDEFDPAEYENLPLGKLPCIIILFLFIVIIICIQQVHKH